jgi:hypothetical protein
VWRAALLLCAGIAGVVHETLLVKTPRIELLVFFGGMMGLPPFLNFDEWMRGRNTGNGKDSP